MSICSMYYIDCFCSQPCPEQREYGFIPEKFNFCSVFGVDFNIKILGVNIILREVSTVSRGKTSTIKLNSSEITAINHILHIFLGFPFFYNRNLHFCCSLQEHRALDQGCEWGEDEAQYWTLQMCLWQEAMGRWQEWDWGYPQSPRVLSLQGSLSWSSETQNSWKWKCLPFLFTTLHLPSWLLVE